MEHFVDKVKGRIKRELNENFIPVSHHTVMDQVRQNLLYELLDQAPHSERQRDHLYQFLAFEPVRLSHDFYKKISNLDETTTLMGRVRVPSFNIDFKRPRLNRWWSPASYFSFGGSFLWFCFLKIFVRALKQAVWIHDELRIFQVIPVNEQGLIENVNNDFGGNRS